MGLETAAVIGGSALLGGIAGSQDQQSSSTSQQVQRVDVSAATQDEINAQQAQVDSLKKLQDQLSSLEKSPIQSRLQSLLQELGQAPSPERIQQANQFASQVFQPQQVALQQSLTDQQQQFAARAAQLGRSTADPILAARLAQEQVRQQQSLSAQQGSFAAQEAVNAPQRQFQNTLAGVSGISGQALQNQSAIFNMGSTLADQLRNFRLATATRTTTGFGTQTQEGPGLAAGILGGAAGGVSIAQGAGMFAQPARPVTFQAQSYPSYAQSFNFAPGIMGSTSGSRMS